MSLWPSMLEIGPIREWPGEMTVKRAASPFAAPLSSTLSDLSREIRAVNGKNVMMLIALQPGHFRIDGRPYANAQPEHPGIILSMDTKHGHLSYPCDKFLTWQDNLRAVVLSLESLRRVDRYGVTKHGEQYRGFLALEATAAPTGFATPQAAINFLASVTGMTAQDWAPVSLVRAAQRTTHPDRGGDADQFQRVTLAWHKLREAGML